MTNIEYLRNQIFQLFQILEDPQPKDQRWVKPYEGFLSNICKFKKDPEFWAQKEEELKNKQLNENPIKFLANMNLQDIVLDPIQYPPRNPNRPARVPADQ